MVDPVATIGGLMFKLTELGTMRGDDGGAPRGLRAHQKTLRNKDQDHTPTDAPKWEPKPKKTPGENQVESVAPPITGQRKTPFHEDRTQRARGSKPSTSEYRQHEGHSDASVSDSPDEIIGSFERGGDRRSSKGAAIQQQSRSKGASWSIWKTPGGTAPDENEMRTESREEKPETIQLLTAIEFKGCG